MRALQNRLSRWRSTLETSAALAMLAASVLVGWNAWENRTAAGRSARTVLKVPNEPVTLDGAETKGSTSAALVLMEFSDFQCPFCARFAKETLVDVEREFIATGKLRLAFRHLPLNGHALAQPAAEAAVCAARQGLFWQMHDRLFQSPSVLDSQGLRDQARVLGLDQQRFDSCVRDSQTSSRVRSDADLARSLGVAGTPAFLIGQALQDGRMKGMEWIGGSLPYSEFKKVIERNSHKIGS